MKKVSESDNQKKIIPEIIAFYLPQFHEIPENNRWWGNGFTEWTNTKKARPLFKGHYQPKQPYNNNYYDLNNGWVLEEQMKLAKKHGIRGFCFYHYWFSGKKLLEKPVEALLQNSVQLPFCLCWANEPWTRAWDGKLGAKETLMKQVYGDSDEWIAHFNYLLPFFHDKRYIKVDGKPVFLIYRTQNIPNFRDRIRVWNQMACREGFNGVYIVQMNTSFGLNKDMNSIDATADFEPLRSFIEMQPSLRDVIRNRIIERFDKIPPALEFLILEKVSYDKVYEFIIERAISERKRPHYLGAFVNWDNTPRRGGGGKVVYNSSPEKFEKYLTIMLKKSIQLNNRFLFLNAWNEWGEGAYLEADGKYGYAYLNAVSRALKSL